MRFPWGVGFRSAELLFETASQKRSVVRGSVNKIPKLVVTLREGARTLDRDYQRWRDLSVGAVRLLD